MLGTVRSGCDPAVVAAVLAGNARGLEGPGLEMFDKVTTPVAGTERGLELLRFAVLLQALDVHYHEPGGQYDRLRESQRVEWVVVSPADVDRATLEPPPGGRAAARGSWIRGCAGEPDWAGDWQYLWHAPAARCVDLRDPFSGALLVRTLQIPEDDEAVGPDVLELLHQQGAPACCHRWPTQAQSASEGTHCPRLRFGLRLRARNSGH
jgi:hypothetical protein